MRVEGRPPPVMGLGLAGVRHERWSQNGHRHTRAKGPWQGHRAPQRPSRSRGDSGVGGHSTAPRRALMPAPSSRVERRRDLASTYIVRPSQPLRGTESSRSSDGVNSGDRPGTHPRGLVSIGFQERPTDRAGAPHSAPRMRTRPSGTRCARFEASPRAGQMILAAPPGAVDLRLCVPRSRGAFGGTLTIAGHSDQRTLAGGPERAQSSRRCAVPRGLAWRAIPDRIHARRMGRPWPAAFYLGGGVVFREARDTRGVLTFLPRRGLRGNWA
jgi:hypothetical protein